MEGEGQLFYFPGHFGRIYPSGSDLSHCTEATSKRVDDPGPCTGLDYDESAFEPNVFSAFFPHWASGKSIWEEFFGREI